MINEVNKNETWRFKIHRLHLPAELEAFESSKEHLGLMIAFQGIIEPGSRVSVQPLGTVICAVAF